MDGTVSYPLDCYDYYSCFGDLVTLLTILDKIRAAKGSSSVI